MENKNLLRCQVQMVSQSKDNDGNERQLLHSELHNDYAFDYQSSLEGNSYGYKTQHLYFTSVIISKSYPNGRILHEGDYCVITCPHDGIEEIDKCKSIEERKDGDVVFYGVDGTVCQLRDCRRIEATTDTSMNLPLIQDSLIQEYVRLRGKITTVELEIKPSPITCGHTELGEEGKDWEWVVKTFPNNCAIIHEGIPHSPLSTLANGNIPIKQPQSKTYSIDEVKQIIIKKLTEMMPKNPDMPQKFTGTLISDAIEFGENKSLYLERLIYQRAIDEIDEWVK